MQRTVTLMFVMLGSLAFVGPAMAEGYEKITKKDDFIAALDGRSVTMGLFDLELNVKPDGTISGTAAGWDVSGKWDWKDGLFCREIDWSGMEIPFNCQLVETDGKKMRFTSDGGQGRSASFTLQ